MLKAILVTSVTTASMTSVQYLAEMDEKILQCKRETDTAL